MQVVSCVGCWFWNLQAEVKVQCVTSSSDLTVSNERLMELLSTVNSLVLD